MASSSKNRKIADEKRIFQDKWENLYFVTVVKDRAQCLICSQFIAVLKDYNVRRHYMTQHGEQYDALSGKIRDEKVQQLKASLKKQQTFFSSSNNSSECSKLFEGISLSANTVASRITESASNIYQQLITRAQGFAAFSLALDESTGVTDTAYCAVFIRGVDGDLNITEELLDLLPMKGTTTGRDIFKELEGCINTAGLPWDKLVSVATDGAPAMCSENVGVVGLLKAKRNQLSLSSPFSAIHCILHQEALCSKSLKMKEVMDFVIRTVNFIRARAFLTDVTEHLNEFNLKLQGPKQMITMMYDSVKAFRCKLSLWAKQLKSGNLAHFSALQSIRVEPQHLSYYSDIISQLLQEFNRRFHEFRDLEPEFALFATPFAVDVACVSEDLQMEIVDLQCDTVLKQKYMDIGVPDFYKFVSQEKFPKLVNAAARITTMFGRI
ncbi:general transcription factor II-I repeat domain-containing protein 2-like [Rhinoderma darwinii]|uniref:general transcription factor II-I repeat domain-containing protein 2-like n=1 Tax=Rhinoderma darwinii TaxID=43563 RepID=UPI003F66A2B7